MARAVHGKANLTGENEGSERPEPEGTRIFGLRRGPLLMIAASFAMTVMVASVKVLRQELSPIEVIAWRSGLAIPIMAIAVARHGSIRLHNRGALLTRTFLGFGAMSCFFMAARDMPLANLSTIYKMQPIFVAIIAPLALGRGERPDRRVLFTLMLGMSGTVLMMGPDVTVGDWTGLWALAAAVFAAGAHTAIRRLGATDHPLVVVFWFQVGACLLGVVAHLLISGGDLPRVPSPELFGFAVLSAFASATGQSLMTKAYALERAATIAAASYAGPLFALLMDLVFFANIPTAWTLVGGGLVVAAGLYLLRH